MSWEEMRVRKYKCPCGSGTYTVRSFMDDWNRTEESWEMDCPICKKKYQLYTYHYYDSGMMCNAYLWVPKDLYSEMEKIKERLEKSKEEVVNLARSRYMGMWLSYFSDAKTKKEVWRRLTNNGERYPSLSTFYSNIKNNNIRKYIADYFCHDNLAFILEKLRIKDADIYKKTLEIKELDDKLDNMRENLIKKGYRQ